MEMKICPQHDLNIHYPTTEYSPGPKTREGVNNWNIHAT